MLRIARAPAVVAVLLLVGCGGPGSGGGLVCHEGAPSAVWVLVAKKEERPIAVDFNGKVPRVWDAENELWRTLSSAPQGAYWTVAPDGAYLANNGEGLFRGETQEEAFAKIGPTFDFRGGEGLGLLGATSDGTYWAHPHRGALHRLPPGATAWEPMFASVSSLLDLGVMTSQREMYFSARFQKGPLLRVGDDGQAMEAIYDCDDPELLFCESHLHVMTANAAGDFFYAVGDRFFRIKAGTKTAREFARFNFTEYPGGFASIAAIGQTLFVVGRTEANGSAEHILLAYEEGQSEPRKVAEMPIAWIGGIDPEVAASSDGSRLYLYGPGVCEVQ